MESPGSILKEFEALGIPPALATVKSLHNKPARKQQQVLRDCAKSRRSERIKSLEETFLNRQTAAMSEQDKGQVQSSSSTLSAELQALMDSEPAQELLNVSPEEVRLMYSVVAEVLQPKSELPLRRPFSTCWSQVSIAGT